MKKLLIALTLIIATYSVAQTNTIDTNEVTTLHGSVELPLISSAFFSRGRLFDKNLSTQPSITLLKDFDFGTLIFNSWQNIDIAKKAYNDNLNETDLTIGYTKTIDAVTFGGGIIDYLFTGQTTPNTQEAYFTISFNVPEEFTLNPSITTFYDLNHNNCDYTIVGINHSFGFDQFILTPDLSLGTATSGYNEYYFGISKSRLNDFSSGLTLVYLYSKNWNFTLSSRYGILVDKEVQEGADVMYGAYQHFTEKASIIYNF